MAFKIFPYSVLRIVGMGVAVMDFKISPVVGE
jgi:hypothetical protein